MPLALSLPTNYQYVLLSMMVLPLECFFFGLIYINGLRGKMYTKEYMQQYEDESQKAFGRPAAKGGYPDSGNGKHSTKWNIQEWAKFNSGYRGHMNFVDYLPAMVVMTLLSGLYWPITNACLGFAHCVFRFLYLMGYVIKPQLRQIGFLPMVLTLLTQIILFWIGWGKLW